ncbi:MAG: thiamine phosphate synthase [Magnetococcales bacterium]|nr:thiamine phosphate synthase [Magnetococcales bacterium]
MTPPPGPDRSRPSATGELDTTDSAQPTPLAPSSAAVIGGIYPILDAGWFDSGGIDPVIVAQKLGELPIPLVQLRAKTTAREAYRFMASWMSILRSHSPNLKVIINDRVDLALALDADGVHVGQEDLSPQVCRKLLGPGKIIGLSTHSPQELTRGIGSGADYFGYGPVYQAGAKSDALSPRGLSMLEQICRMSPLPVVAIGGIGVDQLPEIAKSGAAAAAMISALFPRGETDKLTQAVTTWHPS